VVIEFAGLFDAPLQSTAIEGARELFSLKA
jgi:hypothetical protein